MVLEEQPGKISEAFRLFLQGQGYGEFFIASRNQICHKNYKNCQLICFKSLYIVKKSVVSVSPLNGFFRCYEYLTLTLCRNFFIWNTYLSVVLNICQSDYNLYFSYGIATLLPFH